VVELLRRLERRGTRRYLQSCPDCAVFRRKTHKPYGNLQPIYSPPCPYHTVTIDFIVGLPADEGLGAPLTVTCKFSKQILLIPGRTGGTAFIKALLAANWGIPKVLISERDSKFLSAFWKAVWKTLGTSFRLAKISKDIFIALEANQVCERLVDALMRWPAEDGLTETNSKGPVATRVALSVFKTIVVDLFDEWKLPIMGPSKGVFQRRKPLAAVSSPSIKDVSMPVGEWKPLDSPRC